MHELQQYQKHARVYGTKQREKEREREKKKEKERENMITELLTECPKYGMFQKILIRLVKKVLELLAIRI